MSLNMEVYVQWSLGLTVIRPITWTLCRTLSWPAFLRSFCGSFSSFGQHLPHWLGRRLLIQQVKKNASSFLTAVQWCWYSHPQAHPSPKPATHDNPHYSHVILAPRDSVSPLKPPLNMSAEDNVRVLFSGDVEGKLQQLFKRVQSVSFASLEHWTSVAWLC